mmetsp:Transcript_112699/g.325624  ORF Transcript_112699/g.325624 Transcript_112699/m.325624 type:complete len:279 (+) Transcript_112699:44-880(+)
MQCCLPRVKLRLRRISPTCGRLLSGRTILHFRMAAAKCSRTVIARRCVWAALWANSSNNWGKASPDESLPLLRAVAAAANAAAMLPLPRPGGHRPVATNAASRCSMLPKPPGRFLTGELEPLAMLSNSGLSRSVSRSTGAGELLPPHNKAANTLGGIDSADSPRVMEVFRQKRLSPPRSPEPPVLGYLGSSGMFSKNSSKLTSPLLSMSICAQKIFRSNCGTLRRRMPSSKAFAVRCSSSISPPWAHNQVNDSSGPLKQYLACIFASTSSQRIDAFKL